MMEIFNELKRISKQFEELSNAIVFNPFNDDFMDLFTKKRIELIKEIMRSNPKSIRELAMLVDRNIKNVFEDLKILHNFNIIDFQKIGKCKRPILKRKTIIFKFSWGDIDE